MSVIFNPGRFLPSLPVDDLEMLALSSTVPSPGMHSVGELSSETLENMLRDVDAAAKENSCDWIRRAITSKTKVLDTKDIIDKFVRFLSAGIAQ